MTLLCRFHCTNFSIDRSIHLQPFFTIPIMHGFSLFRGVFLVSAAMIASTLAFTSQPQISVSRSFTSSCTVKTLYAVRYGPPPNSDGMWDPRHSNTSQQQQSSSSAQKEEFRSLLEKIISVKDPQHLPSLLTKNMDLVLSLNEIGRASCRERV